MIVMQQKSKLAKITNKKSTNTHKGELLTQRTPVDTKTKTTELFKVVTDNMTSKWCDKDGCEYTGDSNKKHHYFY